MTPRYTERPTRNHSRRRALATDVFDRLMDTRQSRASRHSACGFLALGAGCGEFTEIERRSFAEVSAPTRS